MANNLAETVLRRMSGDEVLDIMKEIHIFDYVGLDDRELGEVLKAMLAVNYM